MRIAHLVSTFPPYFGGMGNVCLTQVEELVKLGDKVTVFTPGYKNLEKKQIKTSFRIKYLKPWFKWGNAFFVPEIIKDLNDFDIIHLHWPFLGGGEMFLLWHLIKKPKSKLIVQYHMDPIAFGLKGLIFKLNSFLFNRLMVKQADQILFSSQDYLEHSNLYRFYLKNKNKFRISSFGVNQNKFYPEEKKKSLLEKYKINPREKVILSVGGLDRAHYFKGVSLLIKALKKTNKKRKNLKLLIVGEGELKSSYKNLAKKLNLAEKVIFAGRISDQELPDYYNLADIFAFPSFTRSEAFGLVTLEAMACGCPILVSNLPGPRSLVEGNGLIVKVNDVQDLADKILKAFNDQQKLINWKEKSLLLVKEKYYWPKIVEELKNIYVQSVNKKN